MEIVALLIGVALGAVIGWLIGIRESGTSGIDPAELEARYVSKERFDDMQSRLQEEEGEHKQTEAANVELSKEVTSWQERYKSLEERLKEQKEELNQLQDKFRNDFKVLGSGNFRKKQPNL
jgi:DNA recombination protein RmuC